MTERWTRDGVAYGVASALFERSLQAKAVLARSEAGAGIGPSDLMGYIADPNHRRAAEVVAALKVNPKLCADFDHLMRRMARYSVPRLAAASSSGAATSRSAEGCRVTLRPSRADSRQVYVIIELDDLTAAPQALFVCAAERSHVRYPLPPPQDGTVQILTDEASDLVSALRDIDAEVFLR